MFSRGLVFLTRRPTRGKMGEICIVQNVKNPLNLARKAKISTKLLVLAPEIDNESSWQETLNHRQKTLTVPFG